MTGGRPSIPRPLTFLYLWIRLVPEAVVSELQEVADTMQPSEAADRRVGREASLP